MIANNSSGLRVQQSTTKAIFTSLPNVFSFNTSVNNLKMCACVSAWGRANLNFISIHWVFKMCANQYWIFISYICLGFFNFLVGSFLRLG